MPFELNWMRLGVLVRFSGAVSPVDLVGASVAYEADRRFDEIRFVIADFTDIESCAALPANMEAVWVQDYGARKTNPYIEMAVVSEDESVLGLLGHYESRFGVGGFTVHIFPTRRAAEQWAFAQC